MDKSNGRTKLSEKYILKVKGTKFDEPLRKIININDETSLEYLLGAERITEKACVTLQELHTSEDIIMMWYQILSIIAFEIEQRIRFKGHE